MHRPGSCLDLMPRACNLRATLDRPERIRELARGLVTIGRLGGRYVAAVNTIGGDHMPLANYLAFIDGVQEAGSWHGA